MRGIKKWFGSIPVLILYVLGVAVFIASLIYLPIIARGDYPIDNLAPYNLPFNMFLLSIGFVALHIGVFARMVLKWELPFYIDFYIITMVVGHFALGSVFRFYDWVPFYDKIMHGATGAVFVAIGYSFAIMMYDKHGTKNIPPLLAVLFGLSFSLAIGVYWEIFEFAMDTVFGFNMQRWQDYPSTYYFQGSGLIDTMLDFIVHLVGAAIALIVGLIWFAKRPEDRRILIVKRECANKAGGRN